MPRGQNRRRRTRRNAKNIQRSRQTIKEDKSEAGNAEQNISSSRNTIEKGPESVKRAELVNNISQQKNGKNKATSSNGKNKDSSGKVKSTTQKKSSKRINRSESRSFVSRFCWCKSKPHKYLVESSREKTSNISAKVLKTETGNELLKPETSSKRQCNDRQPNQDVRKFSYLKKKKTPHGKVDIYSTDKLDTTEDARITCEAVDLLKHVKNVTKERKERKKKSSEKGGFFARFVKLFRRQENTAS